MVGTISPTWEPQWTLEVKIESGGRYPLGLNRFHNGLEELLIKSVVNNADRLRYFTYCCWAIGDIQRHEHCESWGDFVTAFVRRETALVFGLYLLNPGYGIQGSNKVSLAARQTAQEYDCEFSVMESHSLGAFGLSYLGTTINFGLIETNEKGIYILTESGQKLFEIADQRYKRFSPRYYESFRGKRRVPTDVLIEWGVINDLNNMREPDCQIEREFFKTLLFRLNQTDVTDYRRDSLAFILHSIQHCMSTNTPFTEEQLHHTHYYSSYFDANGTIVRVDVPTHFEDVNFYWRIYEGHAYFRWWLERYFQVFINHLKSSIDGSTLDEFFFYIDQDQFNEALSTCCNVELDWYQQPLETLLNLLRTAPQLDDVFSEHTMRKADDKYSSAAYTIAYFLLTMLSLYRRFAPLRKDRRYQFIAQNLSEDLWFDALFQFHNLEALSVEQFLRRMLRHYVIGQHDRVMMQKNDLRRCWFTSEADRYFFQADVSLIWRPAKFETIMSYLQDLNFIDCLEDFTVLTTEGSTFFQTLLVDYYHG